MSGNSRGLQRTPEPSADDPRRKETYKLGDVSVPHPHGQRPDDLPLPRLRTPPSLQPPSGMLQGTRGLIQELAGPRLHRGPGQGRTSGEPLKYHKGSSSTAVEVRARAEATRRPRGHGLPGGLARLIQAACAGDQPADQNVYDAAAWSAISGLTERSVAEGSRPVEVPGSPAAAGRRRTAGADRRRSVEESHLSLFLSIPRGDVLAEIDTCNSQDRCRGEERDTRRASGPPPAWWDDRHAHAVERATHRGKHARTEDQSQRQSQCRRANSCPARHRSSSPSNRRAQGHADADVPRPLRDDVRHQREDANRAQQERKR